MEKVSTYTGAMFDKLDKLKSAAMSATVTAYCATKSAVGAVGALIGNPLTKDYDVGKHVASFGPNLAWKIFEGRKKTTGQEVSLVVFEKKLLESVDKRDRDTVMEVMKKGAVQLTRLRHPRLLMIQHPVEESRDCLAFATEPIFASLSNVLGRHDNMPSPPPSEFATFEMYDVERVYGLYQLVEGLTFLHNDAKILQGSLCLENIVITKGGQWKIGGLFYSATPTIIDGQSAYSGCQWEPRLYPYAQPNLNYAAPEYILSRTCDVSSDMYSLGILIYAIYNKGRLPYECDNNMTAFKRNVEQMSKQNVGLGSVPQELQSHVRSLLSITPSFRPDVHQMCKISFFENVAALTLQYLDSLMQRDDMAKAQFFKSLYKVMSKLPKRVIMQRVLPQLCLQFSNHQLIPFVLPNVLLITEDCTAEEFISLVLPELKPVFKVQEPVQVTIIFLQKMDLLLSKTPSDSVRDDVLPMVFRALEAPSVQIQEMVLNVIPNFASMVDYALMKNAVIPRIKNLCLQTSSLAVRVNSLVCIGKVLEHLDKYLVTEDILPFMAQIPSREAPTLMAILGIFKQTMVHKKLGMDKDYLAMKAIPYLFPLAIEPSLNLNQFSQYMKMLSDMVKRVEVEHRTKLEQLNKMQEQTNFKLISAGFERNTTEDITVSRSSLKFIQEAQEAKAMDDLVSKIDNAFGEAASQSTEEFSSSKKSTDSSSSSGSTRNVEFNKLFGLPDEPSMNKAATLNGDLLGVKEFSALKPSSPGIQSSSPSSSLPSSSSMSYSQSTSFLNSQQKKPSQSSPSHNRSHPNPIGTITPSSMSGGLGDGGSSRTGSTSMPMFSGMGSGTSSNTIGSMSGGVGNMSSRAGSSNTVAATNMGLTSGGYNSMGTISGDGNSMVSRSVGFNSMNSMSGSTNRGPGAGGYNSMGAMSGVSNMNTRSGANNMGLMSGGAANMGSMGTGVANMGSMGPGAANMGSMVTGAANMGSMGTGAANMGSIGTGMGIMSPMSSGAGNTGTIRQSCPTPTGPSWMLSSTTSRTDQGRASNANALDSLYAPEMSHLQNKNNLPLSALHGQMSNRGAHQEMGMMGVRPQYGGGVMTSTSGMFPMQQQGMMGNVGRAQAPFQSLPQTSGGSANDLKDIFG